HVVGFDAVLACQGKTTSILSGTTCVGHIPIALDRQWVFRLDHLHRVVGEVHDGAAKTVDAILCRPPAPRAGEKFEQYEWLATILETAKADAGISTHFARVNAMRRDLRKGTEQCVGDAKSGQAASGNGCWHLRIDEAALRSEHINWAEEALIVRR